MRKPIIKITDNYIHATIDDSDTGVFQLCNLTDLDDIIVAEIWWSGIPNVKNMFLKTKEYLKTYIYKGEYSLPKAIPTPFAEEQTTLQPNSEIFINVNITSPLTNWSQTTDNATLTLQDDSCIGFDAIVIRVNENSWQCMLQADALTKISEMKKIAPF